MGEENIIQQRKEKAILFFKKNYNILTYIALAIIVFISVKIRTLPMKISSSTGNPGLWDITTNSWTLGPDLDPFLFLRWAKEIVSQGALSLVDYMRYVPFGYDTKEELLLHPYMIAWFHKFTAFFGNDSVTYSAIIYPVFFFALTVIVFFFLVRILFVKPLGDKKANLIALVSSLFLSITPALLQRTIAGIPEKESAALFFFFLAFYLFICAWQSERLKLRILFSVLAGASTACMAMIWGGYSFIFLIISPAVFFSFLFGSIDKNKLLVYSTWIISSFAMMMPFSSRYSIEVLKSSSTLLPAIVVLFILIVHFAIHGTKLKTYILSSKLSKLPPQIVSLIIGLILGSIISSILFGISFVPSQIFHMYNDLVSPATTRLIQTVAENRQPFLNEWINNFGPTIKNFAIFFWLFLSGAVYLFFTTLKPLERKERWIFTGAFAFLLFATLFSRYKEGSALNSTLLYVLGFMIFLGTAGYFYYENHKNKTHGKFKSIEFNFLFLLSFLLISILAARNSVRLVMMLVPPASIFLSYLLVASFGNVLKVKNESYKTFAWIMFIILAILVGFTAYALYTTIAPQAEYGSVPNEYTQQWQKAMSWVRENTQESSVFAHWWDYGYWIQSIGERATVLDGGNAISYWNHMMGRYALTGRDNNQALEFLYAHNTTHFLIDSTDIGKYGAFSSIGSDASYDRTSYISSLVKDDSLTREKKNSTVIFYQGGVYLDEDINYDLNGTNLFLPKGNAYLAAISLEKNSLGESVSQPQGIFVYKGKTYSLPLRYSFDKSFRDFGTGVESGFFIYPRIVVDDTGSAKIVEDGTMLYLSRRTVLSQLARLYLYGEDNPNFKLAHLEEDTIVSQIKSQNPSITSNFVHYGGFRGPIKIWEISYPSDIQFKEEYLDTEYPAEIRFAT